MSTIRRWYIYLVCAVSLQSVVWAVIFLLRTLLWPPAGTQAQTSAFQIAVIVVGLPIFLAHWLPAQRQAAKDPEEGEHFVRSLYLFGMLAGFLVPFLVNGYDASSALLEMALKEPSTANLYLYTSPYHPILRSLLAMAVLAVIFAYNFRLIDIGTRSASLPEVSGVIRRLFVLGFSAAGLFMTALSVMHILRWVLFQISGAPVGTFSAVGIFLSNEFARLLVGLPLWLIFWGWAGRLMRGPSEEERETLLRYFYLYAVIAITVITAVTQATMILASVFRGLLGLPPSGGDIRAPLSTILVMLLLWAYHAAVLRSDSLRSAEAEQQRSIRRLYLYILTAIGFGALLVGLSGNISVLIRSAAESSFTSVLRNQLAWFSAALIAGLPIWLVGWRTLQNEAEEQTMQGAEERRSTVRKIYLYFYLFLATMTVLSGLVYIVYQLLSLILGSREQLHLLRDIGQSIAYALIGAGVWLYHNLVLRKDEALKSEARAARLSGGKVIVFEVGEGDFGSRLLEAIQRALPGVDPALVRLPLAGEGLEGGFSTLKERLMQAEVIAGPWTIAGSEASGGLVASEIARAVQESPARKLLVPLSAEGWDWAGVGQMKTETLVQQTLHAFRQVVEDEPVRPARPMGFGLSVAVLVGVFLLFSLVAQVVSYFFRF